MWLTSFWSSGFYTWPKSQNEHFNILRTRRKKAFFIIFKGLSVTKNRLRPESAPLSLMKKNLNGGNLSRIILCLSERLLSILTAIYLTDFPWYNVQKHHPTSLVIFTLFVSFKLFGPLSSGKLSDENSQMGIWVPLFIDFKTQLVIWI